jgi:hypothetical protein
MLSRYRALYALRHTLAVIALCGVAELAWGQSEALTFDDFRISGFGTVGLSHVDAPSGWSYRRDFSQPFDPGSTRGDLDSRLGLQLNYTPSTQFELNVQAVATRRAAAAPDSAVIQWAFAAYRPTPDLTLRVGRVNLDAYLLSDHRDVGFSYDFARPPVEFYAQLPSSLDGADIARAWNLGGALWRAKLFAGRTSTTANQIEQLPLHPVYGIMGSREADGLLLRVSAVRARLAAGSMTLEPLLAALSSVAALPVAPASAQAQALMSDLNLADSYATYFGLGAQYEHQDWIVSAEATRVSGEYAFDFVAGYGSVGRRFGPVTVFGIASAIESAKRAVATPPFAAELAPVIGPMAAQQIEILGAESAFAVNALGARQRTLSLGARWDLNAQLDLKAQWDFIRVHDDGGALWGNAALTPASANLGTLELDFVF